MHTRMCTDHTTCQTRRDTIAQLSELKPIMLASSVQAVVACNATACPGFCTLVLLIWTAVYHSPSVRSIVMKLNCAVCTLFAFSTIYEAC